MKRFIAGLSIMTAISLSSMAWAAPISFGTPVNIPTSGDAGAVLFVNAPTATFVDAINFGGSAITVTSGANTMDFRAAVAGDILEAESTAAGVSGMFTNASNTNFQTVMQSLAFIATGPMTVRLTGLLAGFTYEVQLFAVDQRDDATINPRTVTFSSPGGGASSAIALGVGDNPQYVIGRFTADGTGFQDIVSTGLGGSPGATSYFNALVLRRTPEINGSLAAVPLSLVMGSLLCLYDRRRLLACKG